MSKEMTIAFEERPGLEEPPITGLRFDEVHADIECEAKALRPGWPMELTVGIVPVGGTYYLWGGGFAKLSDEKVGIPG